MKINITKNKGEVNEEVTCLEISGGAKVGKAILAFVVTYVGVNVINNLKK